MRRRGKIDGNHRQVVEALRLAGAAVFSTSSVGGGFPDLVIHVRGRGVFLVEVKDGSLPPSARKLTPAEEAFGLLFPVHVVSSVEEALDLVRRIRNA